MALSYLQEAQINAGLLASQKFEMKQENDTRRTVLNNNATVALFPRMSAAAAAAAGLSMLTPQQLLAASHTAALMAAGIPVSLHASLAAANPSLYAQNLFNNWQPAATITSPPSPLQAPVSPALSNKSNSRARTNNNNNNNNNMVSSSMDRLKKGMPAGKKRGPKSKTDLTSPTMSEGAAPLSPAISISPEATSSGKDKVFTCRTCSRSFGYKHVLQNHERTHTGEKPFECPECHKRFTRDHHLKTHMRLHTGEKPYHCSHCDRQFVQVANLRRHLRVHTGERPYACELCSQKFSDSNQLKAHVLIHKGEKPFQCEHCQTRFRRRHHMLHHKCGTTSARVTSPSITSDDLEDDIDVDIDGDDDNKQTNINARRPIIHRPMQSPIMETAQMPLNLSSNVSIDMPEQTEPEDLSMHRPSSHSHSSGDSPLSRSPSSDIVHEDEEEELNVSEASPSTLFLQRHHDEYRIHLANLAKNGSNAS